MVQVFVRTPEQYIDDGNKEAITDYKFFCFNGEPEVMYISKDNAKIPETDFFDMEFNHLPLKMRDKNADVIPEKPKYFNEMRNLASILSQGIPHVRVDFYEANNKIYFGEYTFFHCSGFAFIQPMEWDEIFGSKIVLPNE